MQRDFHHGLLSRIGLSGIGRLGRHRLLRTRGRRGFTAFGRGAGRTFPAACPPARRPGAIGDAVAPAHPLACPSHPPAPPPDSALSGRASAPVQPRPPTERLVRRRRCWHVGRRGLPVRLRRGHADAPRRRRFRRPHPPLAHRFRRCPPPPATALLELRRRWPTLFQQVLPVEGQIRVGLLNRAHRGLVKSRTADLDVRWGPEPVQHLRDSLSTAAVGVHEVGALVPATIAGEPKKTALLRGTSRPRRAYDETARTLRTPIDATPAWQPTCARSADARWASYVSLRARPRSGPSPRASPSMISPSLLKRA